MANKFTIGLVQMKCAANAEENLTHAIAKIREAAARGAQIISLHELFHGEYFCRTEDAGLFNLAEAVPGPTTPKSARGGSTVTGAAWFCDWGPPGATGPLGAAGRAGGAAPGGFWAEAEEQRVTNAVATSVTAWARSRRMLWIVRVV